MANITDPEVVRFCNEKVRRLNDMQVALYRTCKQFKAEFDAAVLGNVFTTNGDVVVDGSAQDGRPQVTTFDVNNLYARASAVITDYEANSNTKLNQANAIAVNTNPLF